MDLLGRADLVVTRHVEWGNLLMGFEQQSRYQILDMRTMQVRPSHHPRPSPLPYPSSLTPRPSPLAPRPFVPRPSSHTPRPPSLLPVPSACVEGRQEGDLSRRRAGGQTARLAVPPLAVKCPMPVVHRWCAPGVQVVGSVLEHSNFIMRQILRRRRHFKATIFDAQGRPVIEARGPHTHCMPGHGTPPGLLSLCCPCAVPVLPLLLPLCCPYIAPMVALCCPCVSVLTPVPLCCCALQMERPFYFITSRIPSNEGWPGKCLLETSRMAKIRS